MAIIGTYDGSPIAHNFAPSGLSLPARADGEAVFGAIPIEDPDGTLTIVGHKLVTVEEDDCAQPRIFTGFTTRRDHGRSREDALVVEDARLVDVTIVDMNAALGFRQITGADGNRPAETWAARLTWILESAYLNEFISDDQTWIVANTTSLEAADYRGSYATSVLDDLVDRSGGAYVYYLFWDTAASEVRLFFDNDTEVIGDCTLAISNVAADIDSSTTFAPSTVTQLAREPDQTYSDVTVVYDRGSKKLHRHRPSTATTYVRRGTEISRPYTRGLATATAQAEAFLDKHAVETDRITCTIRVPAASVGLVQAGQRISCKFSHLPGYSGFTWMRIVSCSPKPTDDTGYWYDVSLELVARPVATGGCADECGDVELVQTVMGAEISTLDLDLVLPSPPTPCNLLVLFAQGISNTQPLEDPAIPAGFTIDYQEQDYEGGGGIHLTMAHRVVEVGDGATWTSPANFGDDRRITIMEWSGLGPPLTPAFTRVGDFGGAGVSVTPLGSGVKALAWFFEQSGGHEPGVHWDATGVTTEDYAYSEVAGFALMGSADAGETLSADRSWQDYTAVAIAAVFPSCAAEDETIDLGPTPGATTEHAVPPTVDDDASAGYTVGSTWIDTATGKAYILVDSTDGAAVWVETTGGGTGFVTVNDGGKETVSTVAASGATETLDLADGNVHDLTLTADCTLTFAGATAGVGCSFTLLLRQDGTGGWTATWPGSVVWPGGTAPTLDETASTVAILTFFTLDGGTVWYGFPTGSGGVAGGTPALTFGTTNAEGSATTAILTDATLAIFDATAPTTAAAGDAAAVGSAAFGARRDHRHGMPPFAGEMLVADVPLDFPHGTFLTTASQTVGSTTTAYAVAFAAEGDVDGLTHSTVTNNSRIYIEQSGEYNVIVSAIADLTSGTNQHAEVWLAVDGSPVADTNTIVQVVTTAETVIAAAFNIDIAAGQYLEIMYRGDSTNIQLLQTAAGASPTRPASPAVILTINMEAPLVGFVSKGITLLLNDAGDDLLYADT